MKISYIVNVDLNDKQARAVQVYSNALMFYKFLGDNFKLITPTSKKFDFNHTIWVNNIQRESSKLRKLLFHMGALKYILEADTIYSRNLSVLYLATFFGKNIVWEMHDGLKGFNLKTFNKLRDKLKVVVISNALKEYLNKELDYKKEVLVAHDGVFVEKYDALRGKNFRKELNLPLDKTIVMHTGSLYEGRGAEFFEVVIKNFPDVYFVQVGGSKDYVNKWQKHYKNYDNIQIIGHQNNDTLIKYQMSADLLFLPMTKNNPIWWCTSPMKLFEYMATGIPILASNIGSVGEVLTTNNSIVFNPEDEKTILDGINYFLNNRDSCKKLANNALKDIENKYEWNLRVEKIVEFIK